MPIHELMQPAELGKTSSPGRRKRWYVLPRIISSPSIEIARRHRLHRRLRSHGHILRRLHHAMTVVSRPRRARLPASVFDSWNMFYLCGSRASFARTVATECDGYLMCRRTRRWHRSGRRHRRCNDIGRRHRIRLDPDYAGATSRVVPSADHPSYHRNRHRSRHQRRRRIRSLQRATARREPYPHSSSPSTVSPSRLPARGQPAPHTPAQTPPAPPPDNNSQNISTGPPPAVATTASAPHTRPQSCKPSPATPAPAASPAPRHASPPGAP